MNQSGTVHLHQTPQFPALGNKRGMNEQTDGRTEGVSHDAAFSLYNSFCRGWDERAAHHRTHQGTLGLQMEDVPEPHSPPDRGTVGSRTRLKIHNNLMKAESALTTQIRTEKIGLANFLFIPGVMTPACSCGWQKQTAKHIILHCRLIDGRYEVLKQIGTNDYRTIMSSSKMLKN